MKKRSFRNVRIGKKYGFTLMIVFVLFAIATVMVGGLLYKVGKDMEFLQKRGDIAIDVTEMGSITRSKSIRVSEFVDTKDTSLIEEYTERQEKFNRFEADVREKMESPEELKFFDEIVQLDKKMNDLFLEGVVPAVKSGNMEEAKTLSQEAGNVRSETVDVLYELREILNKQRDIASGNAQASQSQTMLVLVISVLVAILTGSALVFVISRGVSKSLNRVVYMSNEMAKGNLAVEALDEDGKDEIGQLSAAVNEMGSSLRSMMGQISSISETVSSQSEELTQASSEVQAGSEQVAGTMQELAAGSESQAHHASVLSSKMEQFSGKMEEANANGTGVLKATEEVLLKTDEGRNAMGESMDQMSAIDSIVQQSVQKVKGLDAQTKEVTKLVSIINDVADQTNLLALNAAIEAARAGEHGKGFAVVAEEVRKLAEQVSLSVTDITAIVQTIQNESSYVAQSLQNGYLEVERGTEKMKFTGAAFEEINEQINRMAGNIETVTGNLNEMSADSQEIMAAIQEIASLSQEAAAGIEQTSASTQQTNSSMEEVAGSSEQLAKLAEELNGLVRKFTI
jgi:methyl-accepting chemotaxis protein